MNITNPVATLRKILVPASMPMVGVVASVDGNTPPNIISVTVDSLTATVFASGFDVAVNDVVLIQNSSVIRKLTGTYGSGSTTITPLPSE